MIANKKLIAALALATPLIISGVVLAGERPAATPAEMPRTIDIPKAAETPMEANRSIRLSETLKSEVYNQQNAKLGKVEDMVLDGGLNRIRYVVVSYGGILGMGDKLFAVPWDSFNNTAAGPKRVILDVAQDQLKAAPGFDKSNWPDVASTMFRSEVDRYYARSTDKDVSPGRTEKGLTWSRRVTSVIDAKVVNASKEKVGEIYDVIAANQTGSLRYVVLASGGFLEIGEKLSIVPISAITTSAESKEFTISLTKEQLKSAPTFDKNTWPDFSDPQFRTKIESSFVNLDTK